MSNFKFLKLWYTEKTLIKIATTEIANKIVVEKAGAHF